MESPICSGNALQNDPAFRLIETLGWHPGEGFRHQKQHLARMERSAAEFGIAVDPNQIRRILEKVAGDRPLRCRLTLDVGGQAELTQTPLAGNPSEWRLGIADTRLDASDVWLRHKTTRRALYDQARATMSADLDELLFLNGRAELCEGTITNIFVSRTGGELVTPPLSSGLLPGVLRQVMLDQGNCSEAVLNLQDLREARAIYMGNSLRGLIPTRLV
ncbi:aminotransferase class IV family protein [Phaeobacter sp. C3_T13_0]|uniref:aminotransferase class IV family protein n=1 Tax=Phaeobacter cretensis TaxID=3342641 RepID=UPI0039BC6B28